MLLALLCQATFSDNLQYLHTVAKEVIASARVALGAEIAGTGMNTTGFTLRVPGGTQNYYPAFWIRDAAMMLGADLVPREEIEGWIRLVASTQPGPKGLNFPYGLIIPPYSIPDHITLKGEACWYPGAYAEQGTGAYGILPPADDAFYFIQMVYEQYRLAKSTAFYLSKVKTGWGEHTLADVCDRAFDSVAVDAATGLVLCDKTQTRVDWGFCDSIRKTGMCLMPSLLRWQAATRLAELSDACHRSDSARKYRMAAMLIRENIGKVFYRPKGKLVSATDLGAMDDVWASAFAVFLGVLPKDQELAVNRHLLALVRAGGIVAEGQVRHLPAGQHWSQASCAKNEYQNGGYWATPTGWLTVALAKVDRPAADRLVSDFVAHVRARRAEGAPYEWINPATKRYVNGNYGSSAGLVYISLVQGGPGKAKPPAR